MKAKLCVNNLMEPIYHPPIWKLIVAAWRSPYQLTKVVLLLVTHDRELIDAFGQIES